MVTLEPVGSWTVEMYGVRTVEQSSATRFFRRFGLYSVG